MYCTFSDVEFRLEPCHLVELTDDENSNAVSEEVVLAAIDDASAQADALLAPRYAVPIDPAPALLRTVCCDLAIAALFARRRESASPLHQARAEAARDILEMLREGTIVLPGVTPRESALAKSTTLQKRKIFGSGKE